MKQIAFIVPFFYKLNNYANVRSNYDYLKKAGYKVNLFSKNTKPTIDFNKYDLIMLHGSGSFLSEEQYKECQKPIIAFGWSDPNLFNEAHFHQGTVYCTNDFNLSNELRKSLKPIYFYNTACDKRYHIDLNLPKINDVLVYGSGTHKFVPNRNEVVNNLRAIGYKIKVFGRGWDKHSDTYAFITGENLAKQICISHLVLDITNTETAWAHRIFEASARGTPVLTTDREDTRMMFQSEKEILLYNDFEE